MICGVLAVLQTASVGATTYYVFKVTASIPVVRLVHPTQDPAFVDRRTLLTNDVVNLALGRPLTTHVDPKTAVLALAMTFEQHSTSSPLSKLIVFDPSQNGANQVVTVIATLSNLDWDSVATKTINSGQGLGNGQFMATTLGTPGKNGFLSSTFNGSGVCSGPH